MIIFIISGVLYLSILLFKFFLATKARSNREVFGSSIDLSRVTILQPILSGDPFLEEALEFNIIENCSAHFFWLIDEFDIEAKEITGRLKRKYSELKIEISEYPLAGQGINPKVFKLNKAFAKVKTDFCVVLDDDAKLPQLTLQNLVENLEQSDISTALPIYQRGKSFWPAIMVQFVNNNSAMTYLPELSKKGAISINGMCYAMKIETIREINYFSEILTCLADDLSLALLMKSRNKKIFQSARPVLLNTIFKGPKRYFQQMHRWFLFVKLLLESHSSETIFKIFLLYGVPPFLLWVNVYGATANVASFLTLALVVLVRYFIIVKIQKRIFQRPDLHLPFHSLVSELLQPIHLLHAYFKRTIVWRKHIYYVKSNESFFEV